MADRAEHAADSNDDAPDKTLGRISLFEAIAFTVGIGFVGLLASGLLNAMLPWN